MKEVHDDIRREANKCTWLMAADYSACGEAWEPMGARRGRVVGGTDAAEGKWRWQAGLYFGRGGRSLQGKIDLVSAFLALLPVSLHVVDLAARATELGHRPAAMPVASKSACPMVVFLA